MSKTQTAKKAEPVTIGKVLYQTTYNFFKTLEQAKKLIIADFPDQNPKGNQIKGFYQLKAFNDSKAFVTIEQDKDHNMTITLLQTEQGKQVFVKLLKIGKNKFEPPITI